MYCPRLGQKIRLLSVGDVHPSFQQPPKRAPGISFDLWRSGQVDRAPTPRFQGWAPSHQKCVSEILFHRKARRIPQQPWCIMGESKIAVQRDVTWRQISLLPSSNTLRVFLVLDHHWHLGVADNKTDNAGPILSEAPCQSFVPDTFFAASNGWNA